MILLVKQNFFFREHRRKKQLSKLGVARKCNSESFQVWLLIIFIKKNEMNALPFLHWYPGGILIFATEI